MAGKILNFIAACSILLVSACAVGPDYVRPTVSPPLAYKEAPTQAIDGDWRTARPGEIDKGPWWLAFNDTELNSLMNELNANNQNVKAAMAALKQARATVKESRASLFPFISLNSDIIRGRTSSSKTVSNTYTGQVQAGWEIDLWGGTRRGIEGTEAQARVQAADLGAVVLSMRCQLASSYFQLRSLDEEIALYRRTISAYANAERITKAQLEAGVATQADVSQATAQLKSAQAQAVDLELQRNQTEHAIAVYIGRAPADFSLKPVTFKIKPPVIAAGWPSDLLERRPDVAGAEQEVIAANASIGVAQSAWFPVFNFSVNGGYSSNKFHKWVSAPHEIWSIGPNLALTLFQGGAIKAKKEAAWAAWDLSVANYRQTVLSALSEVEDNLAAVQLLEKEEGLQRKALAAAREAERIYLDQFKAGTATYLSVVTAQTSALNSARTVTQLRGQRFVSTIALIKALGGGWDYGQLEADGRTLPDQNVLKN